MVSLESLAQDWRACRVVKHDIWEAEVRVDEETGSFYQWNNEHERRSPLGEDSHGTAHRKRFLVTKYFGLG